MSEKTSMFMAINDITVRVTESSTNNFYYLEFMKPAEYHHENGIKIEDAVHFRIWLNAEKMKQLADILYAQFSMKFVTDK